MALTTFVSGQVLQAQQLNDSFAAVGGLRLITAQTIGSAVSSVTVSDVFSATYDNYYISISGGAASASCTLNATLGATATGYYWGAAEGLFSGTVAGAGSVNGTSWRIGQGETASLSANANIFNPFATNETYYSSQYVLVRTTSGAAISIGGFLNNTTSYTAFTITPSTGTLTGGTIRVYGYQNS